MLPAPNPDPRIRRSLRMLTMVLELHVGKGDVGKVIGKQGRTAHAIRTLIGAVSSKIRKRTVLEIIDEDQDSDFRIPMKTSKSAGSVITSYIR